MEWVVERCGHNIEQSRDDACVRLRGLPFDCTIDEIINFFRGNYSVFSIVYFQLLF